MVELGASDGPLVPNDGAAEAQPSCYASYGADVDGTSRRQRQARRNASGGQGKGPCGGVGWETQDDELGKFGQADRKPALERPEVLEGALVMPGEAIERMTTADLNLVRRAAKERWPVRQEIREGAAEVAWAIASAPDQGLPGEAGRKLAALKVLAVLDSLNLAEQKADADREASAATPQGGLTVNIAQAVIQQLNGLTAEQQEQLRQAARAKLAADLSAKQIPPLEPGKAQAGGR